MDKIKTICSFCEGPVIIRSVRQYPILCGACNQLQPYIKRYTNHLNGTISRAEKERIMQSRTIRGGKQ